MYGFQSKGCDGGLYDDLEAGGAGLYPGISHGENELRSGFIRKVYGILAAQMLLTTVVTGVTVLYRPVNDVLVGTPGLAILPLVLILKVVNPRRTYGPSADIWSLGCTMLEMLTREIPFPNLEYKEKRSHY